MESVKHAAEVAAEKVKEGYTYMAQAMGGAEPKAKDMDPESRRKMEAKNENFNEQRELARQRMDESCNTTMNTGMGGMNSGMGGMSGKKSSGKMGSKTKEGQQF